VAGCCKYGGEPAGFCVTELVSSSSEDLSEYKLSWPYGDWCKFCVHLRSLNVRHFGATELKVMSSRSP
jgi:hypothetical protein